MTRCCTDLSLNLLKRLIFVCFKIVIGQSVLSGLFLTESENVLTD